MKIDDMKVGETRQYQGKQYKCVEAKDKKGSCTGCDLLAQQPPICAPSDAFLGRCSSGFRADGKGIIFKLVLLLIVVALTGCTTPRYSIVTHKTYDANGKLTQTVISEGVEQDDPNKRLLFDIFNKY